MKVKIKRLHKDAKLPNYAHEGDVGLDLYSLIDYRLSPNEKKLFMVGFAMEIPNGYGAFIMDKGSVGLSGLKTFGGVFDAGFRGEYNVDLMNLSGKLIEIKKGQKIAQLVILPVEIVDIEEVDNLSESSRGTGHLGSTGKF